MANVLQDPSLERAVVRAAATDQQAAIIVADLPANVFTVPGLADLLAQVCAAQAAGEPVPGLPREVAEAEPAADPTAAAKALRDMFALRHASDALEVGGAALLRGDPAERVLDAIEAGTAKARQGLAAVRTGEVHSARDLLGGLLAEVRSRRVAREETGRAVAGMSTGFPRLDEAINGLMPTRTYLIGGKPGEGKTTLAVQIGHHCVVREGASLVYLTAEMPATDIVLKILCAHIGAATEDYDRGWAHEDSLAHAAAEMGCALDRIHIIDATVEQMTTDQLLARSAKCFARAAAATNRLVIVDYLQKLASVEAQDRQRAVQDASHLLRALATSQRAAVLALSSLNRAAYSDPTLAGFRESGGIESDADCGLMLTRDQDGTSRLTVVKGRHGGGGFSEPLVFAHGRYAELDTRHEEPSTGGRRRA